METTNIFSTQYGQQIMADSAHIERDLVQFNKQWQTFWDRNLDYLGAVLVCHLTVEHYLTEWLKAAHPGTMPLNKTRLSFAQKLSLIDDSDGLFQWISPGLRRLNKIRNNLSHDLNSAVKEKDLQPIKDIVWTWHQAGGKPCCDGVDLIKDFALMVSGFMAGEAKSITRYGRGDGLIAYRRWLTDAIKIQD